MNVSASAVRVRGLTKRYNDVVAVADLNFDVASGELLTLLGPSGCGKTTTMRAIAGLEKIDQGEIFLGERLVSSIPRGIYIAPEKRDVGMVFQSYAIWPHMTVFENVAYPLRFRKVKKRELHRQVEDVLELVEMNGFKDRPATQLSGGQQQRVALARAMVMRPSVLLLDEPLSNLDAKLRGQMRTGIKELQQRTGLTTIYVTHDQTEAMALSNRIIVMNRGVIEQIGTPIEIYERPRSQFVADFVGAINLLSGDVVDYQPEERLLYVKTSGGTLACAIEESRKPSNGAKALLGIRPEKITIHRDGPCPDRGAIPAASVNRLKATITRNTYCGDHREINAETDGFVFNVFAPSSISVEPGVPVTLEFSFDDLSLLPRGV
jgi:iron(III) transport system ATP-binding protein